MLVILLNARLETYIHDGHSEVWASVEERRGREKGEEQSREEKRRTRPALSRAALLLPGCWVALSLLLGLSK